MYSLASGIYQTYFAPPSLTVAIVGAAGSGKTTLLERCKVTQFTASASASAPGQRERRRRGKHNPEDPLQRPSSDLQGLFFQGDQQEHQPDHRELAPSSGPASSVEGTATRAAADMIHHVKRAVKRPTETLTQRKGGGGNGNGGGSGSGDLASPNDPRQGRRKKSWLSPEDHGAPAKRFSNGSVSGGRPIPGSARRRSTLDGVELQEVDLLDDGDDAYFDDDVEGGYASDDNVSFRSRESGRESIERRIQRQESAEEELLLAAAEDPATTGTTTNPLLGAAEEEGKEFDLQRNAHMLPLAKIRPTIGMNLAKNVRICGANCNFMDLGGRLSDLWERYYADCHAVIFVWKVSPEEDDDDDDDDRPAVVTAKLQLKLLERVRSAIPDDVPFLIVAHVQHSDLNDSRVQTDCCYSTSVVLQHYHNNNQALFFANAATGQGVRSAMEWLVPLAARYEQQLFLAYKT